LRWTALSLLAVRLTLLSLLVGWLALARWSLRWTLPSLLTVRLLSLLAGWLASKHWSPKAMLVLGLVALLQTLAGSLVSELVVTTLLSHGIR
jgi:hypothetical protein